MDIFFSGSILAFVEYSIHFKTEHIQVQALAQWSSGMIPASGAGGHGFESHRCQKSLFNHVHSIGTVMIFDVPNAGIAYQWPNGLGV